MKTGRMGYLLGVFMLAGMLAGCVGGQKLSEQFDEEEVKAAAEEYYRSLNEAEKEYMTSKQSRETRTRIRSRNLRLQL